VSCLTIIAGALLIKYLMSLSRLVLYHWPHLKAVAESQKVEFKFGDILIIRSGQKNVSFEHP
jgi:hypothetical protein